MKIGIDIDDTISDTYEISFAYAQKYTIEELGRTGEIKENVSAHHMYLKSMHDWDDEEEMNFWYKYYGEILQSIKPFTFAVETINQLKEEGHKIVLITARWPEPGCDVEGLTLEWLQKNGIQYDDFVANAQDKAKVALEKKLDLFIDDSFKNCQGVANVGVKTFLMNTRTNQGLNDEKITRVYSWPDIYKRISFEKN